MDHKSHNCNILSWQLLPGKYIYMYNAWPSQASAKSMTLYFIHNYANMIEIQYLDIRLTNDVMNVNVLL